MTVSLPPEAAAALVTAQGIAPTPESAADDARFASLVLGNAAKGFAQLAFEVEPSGFPAAQRKHAP